MSIEVNTGSRNIGIQTNAMVKKQDKLLEAVVNSLDSGGLDGKLAGISQKLLQTSEIMDMMKQHNMADDGNLLNPKTAAKEAEERAQIAAAKSRIAREMAYATDNLNVGAVKELVASGLSLEKISLDILNSVIREIADKPPQQLTDGEIQKIVSGSTEKTIDENSDFIRALQENGVQASEKNRNLLENVHRKYEEIDNLEEGAIAKLIRDEKPLSLENIYAGKFQSRGGGEEKLGKEVMNELLPGIEKRLQGEGLESNKKNMETAKFLAENQLPITKETLGKAEFLQNLNENISYGNLLDIAARNIKLGKNAAAVDLWGEYGGAMEEFKKLEGIIQELPHLEGEKVDLLVKANMPLTLGNLVKPLAQKPENWGEPLTGAGAEKALSGKIQLEEIRLRLTREAAYRLAKKDIKIDTLPLEKALEELKKMEDREYASNLRLMKADATLENEEKMGDLYRKLEAFQGMGLASAIGNVVLKKAEFTINSIGESLLSTRARALSEELEKHSGVVNPKLGDDFSKVKSQLAPLLESLGFEASERNVRSASILSRNSIDITEENLLDMGMIDSKVERIKNSLHPNIAASMIRDGLDPRSMKVDEVLSYIDGFQDQYGENMGDKISRYILEMDNHRMNQDIRENIIDIYKMLNTVTKNAGAALGVTYKHGIELTLGNLVEASKNYTAMRGGGDLLNFSVDETTGAIADPLSKDMERKHEYNMERIKGFAEKAEPAPLARAMGENRDYMGKSLDEATEILDKTVVEAENEAALTQRISSALENISGKPAEAAHWISRMGMEMSLNNISSAKALLNGNFRLIQLEDGEAGEELNELAEEADLKKIREGRVPADLYKEMGARLEAMMDNEEDGNKLLRIQRLRNRINLLGDISERETGKYYIPLKMENSTGSLNMVVLNRDKPAGERNTFMSITTENMGNVEVFLNIKGHYAEALFTGENFRAEERLSRLQRGFEEEMSQLGFETRVEIQTGELKNLHM